MLLKAALPYELKDAERIQYLEPDEADLYNKKFAEALGQMPLGHPQAVVIQRKTRQDFLATIGADKITARVTTYLFRIAVKTKYGEKMPKKDRKIWTRFLDRLEDDIPELELSAEDAVWVRDLFTENVLDSYPPELAKHVNVLEVEVERIRDEVAKPKTDEKPKDPEPATAPVAV